MKEVCSLLCEVAQLMKLKTVATFLNKALKSNQDELGWVAVAKSALEVIRELLVTKYRSRTFTFGDVTHQTILKGYILMYKPDYDVDGTPMLVINDFPLGLKGDKNPVVDLVLRYDTIESRDADIDKLNYLLS